MDLVVASDAVAVFFDTMLPHLNEKQRQAGVEDGDASVGTRWSGSGGWGAGDDSVGGYGATQQLRFGFEVSDRRRVAGGGNHPGIAEQSDLLHALRVSPRTRGVPMRCHVVTVRLVD